MPPSLKRVRVEGFRSLERVDLELGRINVLIGPNGAGKSNLLEVLRLAPLMRTQSLRRFVGEAGGASALLRYGPKVTPEMSLRLEFALENVVAVYSARLGYAAGDSLVFLDEAVGPGGDEAEISLGTGHAESQLSKPFDLERFVASFTQNVTKDSLSGMSFFHFHDTSRTSVLRQHARQVDAKYLRSDGSNLASFLLRLRDQDPPAWRRIAGWMRQIAPFIKELQPSLVDPTRPEASAVRLDWVDERDHVFGVQHLSDGTLRALALISALSQPVEVMPSFVCIDEPELGLHPAAISLLAALVRSASAHCQIVLATQSPALLDHFAPEEVIVTERGDGASAFRRLDAAALAAWLEDYSLSELYEKNVLGGRP
jgi:predicted ATPase